MLFEHATARAVDVQHLPLCRRCGALLRVLVALGVAYIVKRRLLPLAACWASWRGAVRGAGHRAGDRLLCRLCAAAVLALRHRADHDPRLHHALPADRLRHASAAHPQPQPGDGGGGAHPRRRPADGAAPGGGAAAEAHPARRLAAGLHPGDARAVDRGVPVRARTPGDLGDDARPERAGQLRIPRGAGRGAAGRDHCRGLDRPTRARARLHAEADRE